MKYLLVFLLFSGVFFCQFKEDLDNSELIQKSLYTEGPSGFFTNFLSSENFKMKHTFTMSYTAGAGNGIALGVYTNSMLFNFTDDLKLQVDASFVNSPYNTLGQNFTNDINGVYISNARLDYKISEKAKVTVQYRNQPYNYYNGYGFGYGNYYYPYSRNSWLRDSFFDD